MGIKGDVKSLDPEHPSKSPLDRRDFIDFSLFTFAFSLEFRS
jgi:hypothetical protein